MTESSLEALLRGSVLLAQRNKRIAELEEQVRDLQETNCNLRARLNAQFDLSCDDRPALLRLQAD